MLISAILAILQNVCWLLKSYCLSTGVTRHSAHPYMVHPYMVRIICKGGIMEAENSITYYRYQWKRIYSTGMAEMIMGFHEYTYQDREYIIRAMNTKHALLVHSAQPNPHTAMLFSSFGCLYQPILSHPFTHWTNLPRKLLEVTSQIVWHIQCML